MVLAFPPFRLDLKAERLDRDGEPIRLRPKTWEVLRLLVERAGELVTTDELLRTVWRGVAVSSEVPAVSVREIRRALGDVDAQRRFIETVPARGFRFVAKVAVEADERGAASERIAEPVFVGREAAMATLDACFREALSGVTRVAWIEGELGVGKSTLVDAALRAMAATAREAWIGRGQSLDVDGAREEFMPVFAALTELARGDARPIVRDVVRTHAPSCAPELPSLFEADVDHAAPTARAARVRELADAIVALASVRPVVFAIEDLHAADGSTLDVLSMLLRRRAPVPLLVVVSTRAQPGVRSRLSDLRDAVSAAPSGATIVLDRLGRADVERWVSTRLRARVPADLVDAIVAYAEGLPMLVAPLLEWLRTTGALVLDGDAVRFERDALAEHTFPEALRSPIARRLRELPADARAVVEAAAVAGDEFDAAIVAGACERTEQDVETICELLASSHRLLRRVAIDRFADGRVSGRHAFANALTRVIAYDELPSARRAALHLAHARSLERAHRAAPAAVSGELAMHFRLGGDLRSAARCQLLGAELARRAGESDEAIELLEAAEALLPRIDAPDRGALEAKVALARGAIVMQARGYDDAEAREAFRRAHALARASGVVEDLAVSLDGLWRSALASGAMRDALSLAHELAHLAATTGDPAVRMSADAALGETSVYAGVPRRALKHLERCRRATSTPTRRGDALVTFEHPAVRSRSNAAIALWLLGLPDRALDRAREAVEIARELVHPPALAYALNWAAALRQMRGEIDEMERLAREAEEVAQDADVVAQRSLARLLVTFARASRGEEIARKPRWHERARASLRFGVPYVMTIAAELSLQGGDVDGARAAIEAGLEVARRSGERAYEPELLRMRASALGAASEAGARALRDALDQARAAGLRGIELRIATSLGEVLAGRGERAQASALVSASLAAIRGGDTTRDVIRARALLRSIDARGR